MDEGGAGVDRHDGGGVAAAGRLMPAESAGRGTRRGGRAGGGVRLLRPVAANSPGRPRRLMAKPEEVGTGSRLSGITRGIMGHDPVAMACTAGGVVGL